MTAIASFHKIALTCWGRYWTWKKSLSYQNISVIQYQIRVSSIIFNLYARARSNERFWYWMRRTMLNSVNIKSIVIHTTKKAMLRVTQNEIFFWMVRFCFIFKVFWNLSLGEEEAVVGWSVQVGFYSTYSIPTTKFRLIKCTTAQHIFPNWFWFPIYCYWWQKSS